MLSLSSDESEYYCIQMWSIKILVLQNIEILRWTHHTFTAQYSRWVEGWTTTYTLLSKHIW